MSLQSYYACHARYVHRHSELMLEQQRVMELYETLKGVPSRADLVESLFRKLLVKFYSLFWYGLSYDAGSCPSHDLDTLDNLLEEVTVARGEFTRLHNALNQKVNMAQTNEERTLAVADMIILLECGILQFAVMPKGLRSRSGSLEFSEALELFKFDAVDCNVSHNLK